MTLEWLPMDFSVCKVGGITGGALAAPFTFFARTDEEISLVCPSEYAPADALKTEPGWRAFRVKGPLDFSLIGILADIAACLARRRVSIFAVSTFDTDYILVKADHLPDALEALEEAGYETVKQV